MSMDNWNGQQQLNGGLDGVPAAISDRIERTLSALPERKKRGSHPLHRGALIVSAAAVLLGVGLMTKVSFTEPSTTVQGSAIQPVTVEPRITKNYGDYTLRVNKAIIKESSIEVNLDLTSPTLEADLKKPESVFGAFSYELVDETGRVYESKSSESTSNGFLFEDGTKKEAFSLHFRSAVNDLEVLPERLILKVYKGHNAAGLQSYGEKVEVQMKESPTPEHPIVLSQGEAGSLSVTSVEFEKEYTLVKLTAQGDRPVEQVFNLGIEASGKAINRLPGESFVENKDSYEWKFPALSPDVPITFYTYQLKAPTPVQELEVAFDVPQ